MSFAREGWPFIGIGVAAVVIAFGAAVQLRSWPLWVLAVLVTVLALWCAYFFRDPERTGPRGARLVIAPADGKVMMITDVDEPRFIQGHATRVSIFMNVFNVHVNRYPVDGRVDFVWYNKGKFLNAAAEKSSLENEQMSVGVTTPSGVRILTRQIAGLIARRIVTYSKVGDEARQGERFGIIRFGSRVDVFIPPGSVISAKLGDITTAGTTVIAELAP
ncbi:MAG: phosphatidylserine decarboxylase family protein [Gemmatimonadota bacterium]|nr:phosphatidylserine decarboxylase family protein [Gemmatimonadota bacterium]